MTRSTDARSDVTRNGEPYGELGMVIQQDKQWWGDQTGGPVDPQTSGHIAGGARDVLRSADFNSTTQATGCPFNSTTEPLGSTVRPRRNCFTFSAWPSRLTCVMASPNRGADDSDMLRL